MPQSISLYVRMRVSEIPRTALFKFHLMCEPTHTQDSFDLNWIRNAIEEPLDEMDIQASTRLE